MPKPERRTRVDLAVAAVIVVVIVVAGVAIWSTSAVRGTSSDPAQNSAPLPTSASSVPSGLTEAWRAASNATTVPVVIGPVVVTGDGGTVIGHDPSTGRELWSYRRDLPLCGVAGWPGSGRDYVIAVYRNARGCSEVTALYSATGQRAASRSSDADSTLDFSVEKDYFLAQGDTRLETWRSDLVRTIEYGRVDAPVNPGAQPRSGCELLSSAIGSGRVAVVERCGIEPGYRLTVLGATLDKDEKLDEQGSTLITADLGSPPRVVAVGANGVAVYVSSPSPMLETYALDGTLRGRTTLLGRAVDVESKPVSSGGLITFWTGEATLVLDASTLQARFQVPATLGPGVVMAGSLLLPSASGISEHNIVDGRPIRSIPVPRSGYGGGIITLGLIGDNVVQQWGPTISVLKPSAA
ncbi:Rv3212 family protein [Williamsia muralis]|uniref:Rv3212 family protein n=1 Tax=Williamsia marianensis TaxID=85044 RepID=UPI00381C3D81